MDWSRGTALVWFVTSALFLYLIWQTTGFHLTAAFAYPLVCAAVALCLSLRCLLRREPDAQTHEPQQLVAPALVFAVVVAYWLALTYLGFLVASATLTVIVGVTCTPRQRQPVVLISGLSLVLLIWGLFTELLGADLPTGTLIHG